MADSGKISINLVKVGCTTLTADLDEGATLADALAVLGDALGKATEVYVNGKGVEDGVTEDTELRDNDTVAAVPPVKAG